MVGDTQDDGCMQACCCCTSPVELSLAEVLISARCKHITSLPTQMSSTASSTYHLGSLSLQVHATVRNSHRTYGCHTLTQMYLHRYQHLSPLATRTDACMCAAAHRGSSHAQLETALDAVLKLYIAALAREQAKPHRTHIRACACPRLVPALPPKPPPAARTARGGGQIKS